MYHDQSIIHYCIMIITSFDKPKNGAAFIVLYQNESSFSISSNRRTRNILHITIVLLILPKLMNYLRGMVLSDATFYLRFC